MNVERIAPFVQFVRLIRGHHTVLSCSWVFRAGRDGGGGQEAIPVSARTAFLPAAGRRVRFRPRVNGSGTGGQRQRERRSSVAACRAGAGRSSARGVAASPGGRGIIRPIRAIRPIGLIRPILAALGRVSGLPAPGGPLASSLPARWRVSAGSGQASGQVTSTMGTGRPAAGNRPLGGEARAGLPAVLGAGSWAPRMLNA